MPYCLSAVRHTNAHADSYGDSYRHTHTDADNTDTDAWYSNADTYTWDADTYTNAYARRGNTDTDADRDA